MLMESVSTGTLAGAGTFGCEACGFPIALHERDEVPACPQCGEERFVRQSMFAAVRPPRSVAPHGDAPPPWLADARDALTAEGDYLAYEHDEGIRVVQLQEGLTRIGRSLAANVRFDDPTVSRRHAVVQRERESTTVVDDRSLNGVFVNGERREARVLADGDELLIGRFRLYFIRLASDRGRAAGASNSTSA